MAAANRRTRAGSTRRVLGGAGLAVALTLPVACNGVEPPGTPAPPPAADPPAPDAPEAEEAVAADLFERVNDERRARDLEPVEWDEQLAELAREWSDEMVDIGLQHRDLEPALFEDRLRGFVGVGENIFSADALLPAGHAHVGWMQSPGHRANILDPDWDRLGIGVRCTAEGEMYATQNFGRTAEAGVTTPGRDREPPPEEPFARPETDGPSC